MGFRALNCIDRELRPPQKHTSDPQHERGVCPLSADTRQLLRSCLKLVWKLSRVKSAREERPVAANSLRLQESQGEEEELAWRGGRGACVVPSVARRYGGEAVSRPDGERGWRRRRAAAFFSADTLIEIRGSREIKAARRLRGSASLFSPNKR